MIDQLLAEAKSNPITGVVPVSVRRDVPQVGDIFLFDGVEEQPAVIDDAVARPTGFRYVAAWLVPSKELIHKFEQRVENLGWWFDFFEQENAWGEMNPESVLGEISGKTATGLTSWKVTLSEQPLVKSCL